MKVLKEAEVKPKKNILLVDDSEIDREVILSHFGYNKKNYTFDITPTKNLDEAIAASKNTKFDCVILDYKLGLDDGLDFIRYDRGAPIILLTGYADSTLLDKGLEKGVRLVLHKDITNGEELVSAVERLVS